MHICTCPVDREMSSEGNGALLFFSDAKPQYHLSVSLMAIRSSCLSNSSPEIVLEGRRAAVFERRLKTERKHKQSNRKAREIELETREDLLKLVKSRLPGGFAAQPLHGTGRRKSASARVVLQEGSGKIIINYRNANEYLQGNPLWIQYVKTPLATLGYEASYDIFVKVEGGGLSGQAQAISLGIARALLKVSDSHRKPLKEEGLLTRDARVVERKKVGLKKARKRPQFSKR
ncbi:hypothetical protein RND71_031518 [Anisodus tanguticus]|uniref:Small ribosomal subunit protein uS9c n=1 Tax=Anisodus tanguticus TaxID=243964 RepID=A0AAE1RBZ0_9SOLA|nr:hypothetical protein RND71_031518 [Anisodus tanguticus]